MKTLDQTLEQLDNILDDVDELLNELPVDAKTKHNLVSKVYDLWMDVESAVEKTVDTETV